MASSSDTFNSHISSDDAAIFSANSSDGQDDDNETEDPTGRATHRRNTRRKDKEKDPSQLPTFLPSSRPLSPSRPVASHIRSTSGEPRPIVKRTRASQG